jgi:hypothetical protein
MKMRWMAVVVVALMASACGGTEEESTDAQAPHANVNSVAGASLHNGGGASQDENIAGGGPCGTNYCGKDTFCCNASCGICAPLGGGCPDVMCAVAQQPQETHSASVVQPPSEVQLAPPDCGPGGCDVGYFCCGKNVCCAIM